MGINVGAFYAPFAAAGIKQYFMDNFGTTLAQGYNAAFGVAAAGMVLSLVIFILFRSKYKDADYQAKNTVKEDKDLKLTKPQEKERVIALFTIFAIVIFFWLAFHQNGAALSLFARDYTDVAVGKFTFVLFDIIGLHALLAVILGTAAIFNKSLSAKIKGAAGFFIVAGLAIIVYKMTSLPSANTIAPEQFQSFNPMFIILLTPLIV